jgi:hypothetical protein
MCRCECSVDNFTSQCIDIYGRLCVCIFVYVCVCVSACLCVLSVSVCVSLQLTLPSLERFASEGLLLGKREEERGSDEKRRGEGG